MLVLVVEDDLDTREAYERIFSARGFDVDSAITGPQALNKALLRSPDVIVLDIALPEMDGWETLRQWKARLTPGRFQ